jgi:putative Holliday junction resolvase
VIRTMGLDVGSKTVGVAVSDELGFSAHPITTVRRTNLKQDLRELARLIDEKQVGRIVVGLPLNMNGTEGSRATESRKLGDALSEQTKLSVIYWDERLTTVAAEKSLLEADVSRKKRKEVIDQVAACLILQGWLDSQPQTDE